MQVSVENTGKLERRMTVQVPAERIDREVDNRLQGMMRTVRIDGFRPGKVPRKVIERKYGNQVRKEVIDEMVRTTLDEAMSQQQLEPAGEPRIEWPDVTEAGAALKYVVTFEVYPELPAIQMGSGKLEKPVVEITADDVQSVLEKLRQQRLAWEPVDRPAKKDDRLIINYSGVINDGPFPGNKGNNVQIVLGSESIVDGFDDQLVGKNAGDECSVKITYPKDHPVEEIAGNEATYTVKIVSVAEPKLPELNDDLARSFGIAEKGLDGLKEEVRENMGRELEQALRMVIKERVFENLLANNPIEVPDGLIEEERRRMAALRNVDTGEASPPPAADDAVIHRRVALGMLVGKVIKDNGIQVDPVKVRAMVDSVAASYEDSNQVVTWYYDNPDRLSEVQASVLEDQVVEWLLGQMNVSETPMTFDELMQLRHTAGA